VGIGLWLVSGVAAFVLARIIPLRRPPRRLAELGLAIAAALLLGVVATAMDFGGWKEPDWRAGTFALLGAFAAIGAFRAKFGRGV
jgi:hypothetical protein